MRVIPHAAAHLPCLGFQQSMRENKEKQALSDLMIKPVQRIPRYELLVKVGKAWRRVGMPGALRLGPRALVGKEVLCDICPESLLLQSQCGARAQQGS